MGNEERMSWQTADLLSADTADVLAADTTDVMPADKTHVLPADKAVGGQHKRYGCPGMRLTSWAAPPDS